MTHHVCERLRQEDSNYAPHTKVVLSSNSLVCKTMDGNKNKKRKIAEWLAHYNNYAPSTGGEKQRSGVLLLRCIAQEVRQEERREGRGAHCVCASVCSPSPAEAPGKRRKKSGNGKKTGLEVKIKEDREMGSG